MSTSNLMEMSDVTPRMPQEEVEKIAPDKTMASASVTALHVSVMEEIGNCLLYPGNTDEPFSLLVACDEQAWIYDFGSSRLKTINVYDGSQTLIRYEVFGTWKGMVALYQRSTGTALLFNPDLTSTRARGSCWTVTRETTDPKKKISSRLIGLCYDAVEDCYKGVIVESLAKEKYLNIHVLNFKSGKAESKKQFMIEWGNVPTSTGTVVNGVPYWIVRAGSRSIILEFDQKTEQLMETWGPPYGRSPASLGTLGGKLTATAHFEGLIFSDVYEVWIRKEMHGCIDWQPICKLNFGQNFRGPVSTLEWMDMEGGKLLGTCSAARTLMICEVGSGSMDEAFCPKKDDARGCPTVAVYSPTLCTV